MHGIPPVAVGCVLIYGSKKSCRRMVIFGSSAVIGKLVYVIGAFGDRRFFTFRPVTLRPPVSRSLPFRIVFVDSSNEDAQSIQHQSQKTRPPDGFQESVFFKFLFPVADYRLKLGQGRKKGGCSFEQPPLEGFTASPIWRGRIS